MNSLILYALAKILEMHAWTLTIVAKAEVRRGSESLKTALEIADSGIELAKNLVEEAKGISDGTTEER